MSAALTFSDFASMCAKAEAVRGLLPVHVQFRKRGEILCALVLDAKPASGGHTVDYFQLESGIGVNWCAHYNVRACSGLDGRCTCEGSASMAARACAGGGEADASPLGNTGVTL